MQRSSMVVVQKSIVRKMKVRSSKRSKTRHYECGDARAAVIIKGVC